PDRVADGDEVDAGALRDQRDLIVPGDHAGALLPVALHLLEHGDGDGGLARRHGVVLFGSFAPRASSADCGRIAPLFAHPLRGARTFNCQQPSAMGSGLWVGRGVGPSLSFLPLENEGSDAPRRRVVRITPDGPDDHSGRTRIAGSWRISG